MKSVAICASKTYVKEVQKFARALEKHKVVVFEPNFKETIREKDFFHSEHVTNIIFKGLTLEHFNWIRKADVCFIFNIKDYMGVSMTLEMGYAQALGKPIFALSPKTGDPCRDALIDKVAPTPQALAKLLL